MEKGQLQRSQKFEVAKNNIKTFSGKIPKEISLPRVQEEGLWGMWDRDVTGKEMNNLTSNIQNTFIKFNEVIKDIVKEFREVYTALDFLDKDYIQTFLVHIKAIEKNNEDIIKTNEDIYEAQKNINTTIQGLKIIVDNLSEFKNTYKDDVENTHAALQNINDKIEILFKNLESAREFSDILDNLHHLKDIDSTWEDVQNHKSALQDLKNQILTSESSIKNTNEQVLVLNNHFENLQKIKHLESVDLMWIKIDKLESKTKNLHIIIGILALLLIALAIFNFIG